MNDATSYAGALPFEADLRLLYPILLYPKAVAFIGATDLGILPLDDLLAGGSRVWLVDSQPGRAEMVVSDALIRKVGDGYACLACDAANGSKLCASFVPPPIRARACSGLVVVQHLPPRCVRYQPAQEPGMLAADGALGRADCFATRIEEIVARAGTARGAVQRAIDECRRCASMNVTLPIESHSMDLVISVLAPSRMLREPYAQFHEAMERRFGAWQAVGRRSKLPMMVEMLRAELFRMQACGHAQELHRLVKHDGCVYFATHPVEAADDGWTLEPGVPQMFEVLGHHFVFDFERFQPEAFLRRAPDPTRLVQAALLKPRKDSIRPRGVQ